ncbi:MAG TPA: hypothetical protein VJH33_02455 [Candidatus Paceibacterota bacterium]
MRVGNSIRLTIFLYALLVVPFLVGAQTEDTRAVLYNVLAEDADSEDLSSEEFEALIEALVARAEKEGVTGENVALDTLNSVEVETCAFSRFICIFSEAFGVSGSDHRLLIVLGASSGALALIFAKIFARPREVLV